MLVLVRREQEDVIISDDKGAVIATIKLIEATNGMCKVGISADRKFNVDREEIYKRKIKDRTINYAKR